MFPNFEEKMSNTACVDRNEQDCAILVLIILFIQEHAQAKQQKAMIDQILSNVKATRNLEIEFCIYV